MRVIMQMVADKFAMPGGHRRQLDMTAEYVRRMGVEVEISCDVQLDLQPYDVVHNFCIDPTLMRNVIRQGKPLAVSPIYWSYEFDLIQGWMEGRLKGLLWESRLRLRRAAAILLGGEPATRRAAWLWTELARDAMAYRCADILLPNAHAEGEDLVRECDVAPETIHFVPNAVDVEAMNATPNLFHSKFDIRDFVLCVGRCEPRKNQLRLIQALHGTEMPLVIVDPIHPDHAAYRDRCRKAMGRNMFYLESLPEPLLRSAYAAARVHALPSFFETTGLVTLEAALSGCNVVVNEQRHTREYFQDHAWYCNPYDVNSIRSAVQAAYQTPWNSRLRRRILDNFTWEHTAAATVEAYERVLRRRCNQEADRTAAASLRSV